MVDLTVPATVYLYQNVLIPIIRMEDIKMKTAGTTHKTFTRTFHLVLYLILVIVFGFISCRFAKASGTSNGDPGDSIRNDLSDTNKEIVNRLAYLDYNNSMNYSYTAETVNESIILENLHYYFRKAMEPAREQSLRLENWMLDTGDMNFDTVIPEPEIRLESWMVVTKNRKTK